MFRYLPWLSFIVLISCPISISLAPSIAQAQLPQSSRPTAKQELDQRQKLYDESCVVPEKKIFQGLEYQLCRMEDSLTRVSIAGPAGENGPTAYFYSGRLYAFRDTGRGQAWIFQNGQLMAEVEVGVVAPEFNPITTKFTAQVRKQNTDRAISSTRNMLKVFGVPLQL
jgi:hypothetical protein